MSITYCHQHDRSYDSDWDEICPECAGEPHYYCGDCDRVEDDPMWTDLEQCSACGAYISVMEDVADVRSPDERARDDYGLSIKDFV